MKLSLIVRSFNDEGCIRRTLEMLRRQSREAELIVFDSGSTDGTLEIVRSFKPDRLVNGRAGDYLPGRVVNEAARIASGDVLVFNNSDCVPLDESWLEKLVRPLEEGDGTVAAAFANQLPRPDAFALVRKDNERAFGDGSIAAKWKFFFSLASSAIPRKLLLERPFNPEFRYSEDVEWAHRMALEGRKLVYVPEARVEHSHNYTPAQLPVSTMRAGLTPPFSAGRPVSSGASCCRSWLKRSGISRTSPGGAKPEPSRPESVTGIFSAVRCTAAGVTTPNVKRG